MGCDQPWWAGRCSFVSRQHVKLRWLNGNQMEGSQPDATAGLQRHQASDGQNTMVPTENGQELEDGGWGRVGNECMATGWAEAGRSHAREAGISRDVRKSVGYGVDQI